MPRNGTIPSNCAHCGETILLHAYQLRESAKRFCNSTCRGLFVRAQRPWATCVVCLKPFQHVAGMPRLRCRQGCKSDASRSQMFFELVTKQDNGCWTWSADRLNLNGYGTFNDPAGRQTLAHRVAWEMATGMTLSRQQTVMHACDTPSCVRNDTPDIYVVGGISRPRMGHLVLGSQRDNVIDMLEKQRSSRGPSHPTRHGSEHTHAVLSKEIVRYIRDNYTGSKGEVTALAAQLGLNYSTVWLAASRKTWRHVQ